MRRLTSFIVLALVAAGCGSAEGVAGSSSATTLAGGTGEQTPIVIPDTTARQPGPTSPAPRLPADLPDSDFPDVVVADLAGGNINLRMLVLETKPVLLWFWAPH